MGQRLFRLFTGMMGRVCAWIVCFVIIVARTERFTISVGAFYRTSIVSTNYCHYVFGNEREISDGEGSNCTVYRISTKVNVSGYRLYLLMMVLVIRMISSVRYVVVRTNGFDRRLLVINRCLFRLRCVAYRREGVFRRGDAHIFTASAVGDGWRDLYRINTYAGRLCLFSCFLVECTTNGAVIIQLTCFARRVVVFMLCEENISEGLYARFLRAF